MRNPVPALVIKDLTLVFHPMSIVILALAILVIVPNWPYAVILLYGCLCPYFNAQNAREQRDLDYAAVLPVSRHDMVVARVAATMLVEGVCVGLMFGFSLLRPIIGTSDMFVGMPPNVAFLGFALATFALFDLVFFPLQYQDPSKVGIPLVVASVPTLLFMIGFEVAPYVSPVFSDLFAQSGFANMGAQLGALVVGVIIFLLGHVLTTVLAAQAFERVDF